nr:inter-alpha-trypsin inhibitor-like [Drosophila bipectinata]
MGALVFRLILVVLILAMAGAKKIDWEMHHRRKAICLQPVVYGTCRVGVNAWHYKISEHKCVKFVYRLCGGNQNRFYSKKECEEMCDLPWIITPDFEYFDGQKRYRQ